MPVVGRRMKQQKHRKLTNNDGQGFTTVCHEFGYIGRLHLMPSLDRDFAETLKCLLVGQLFQLQYNGVIVSFNVSDFTIFQADVLLEALELANLSAPSAPLLPVQSTAMTKAIPEDEVNDNISKVRLRLMKHYYLLQFHHCSESMDFEVLPVKLRGKDQSAIVCYATATTELDLRQEIAASFLVNQMKLFRRRHLGRGQVQPTPPPLFPRNEPIEVKEWPYYAQRLPSLFLAVTEPLLAIHRAFLVVDNKIDIQIQADASASTGRLELAAWLASTVGTMVPANLLKTNSLLFGKVLRRVAEIHKVGLRIHGRLPIRIVSQTGVRVDSSNVDGPSKRQRIEPAETADQTSLAGPELTPLLFHLAGCPDSNHCDCLQQGIRSLKAGEPVVLNVAEVLFSGWITAVDQLVALCERNKKAYFRLRPVDRGEQVRLISGGLYMQLHKDNNESYAHYNNVVLPTLTRVCAPLCLGAWDQPASDAFLFSIQAFTASYLSNSKEASSPNGQTPHTDLAPTSQPNSPFTILISGAGGVATRYLPRPPELAKDQLGQLFMQHSVKDIVHASKPFAASGHFEPYQIAIFSATDLLHFAPPHDPATDKRQNFFQMAVLLGTQLESYNGDNQNLPLSLLLDHLERKYGPERAINYPAVFRLICQSHLDGYDPSVAWTEPRRLVFQELRRAYTAAGRHAGDWKPSSALRTRWAAAWLLP